MENLIPQQIKTTLEKIKSLFIRKDPQELYFETVRKKQTQRKNKGIAKALVAFSSHVQKQGPLKPQSPLLNTVTTRKVYSFNNFDEEEYDQNPNLPHNLSFQQDKPANTSEIREQRVRNLRKKIMIQQYKNKRNSGGGFGYGFQEGRENQNDNSTILNYQQQIDDLLAQKGSVFMNKKQHKRVKQHYKYFKGEDNRNDLVFDKEPIKVRQQSFTYSKSNLDCVQQSVFSKEYQSFHSLSQQKQYSQRQQSGNIENDNTENLMKGKLKMSLKQIITEIKDSTQMKIIERKASKIIWNQGIKPDFHPKPIEIKRPYFLDLLDVNDCENFDK